MKTTNVHKLKTYNSQENSFSTANTIDLRHYRFAQKHVELNLNATQAYLAIYGEEYKAKHPFKMSAKTAQAASSRLLSNVMVNKYIYEITNDALVAEKVRINSVIARYNRWADSDITDYIDQVEIEDKDQNGNSYSPPQYILKFVIKDLSKLSPKSRKNIQSITFNKDSCNIATVCKKSANDMLFKYLDLGNRAKHSERKISLHFDSIMNNPKPNLN